MSEDTDLPAASPPAGDSVVFGHFQVPRRADGRLWELGRGTMGVTYRAFDTGLRREVALKVIAADKVADEDIRARFLREARAAAKVRHHNVASVLYLGEQAGEFFYAMEFIAGRSLTALLAETSDPLPPAVAVGLAAQVAAGLNAAHRKEVLHRDLKPANLMLLEGDAADHEDERTEAAGGRLLKIIDFGLARSFGAGRQEDSFVTQSIVGFIGTPAYASPEQAGGDVELDGRSDLYSLGVILWQMLTGRLPFTGSPMVMLSKHLSLPPPFERLAGLPDGLVELLRGLLVKEPGERRPQTAAELRLALDEALRALPRGGTRPVGSAPGGSGAPIEDGGPPGGGPLRTPTTSVIEPGTTLLDRYRLGLSGATAPKEVLRGTGGADQKPGRSERRRIGISFQTLGAGPTPPAPPGRTPRRGCVVTCVVFAAVGTLFMGQFVVGPRPGAPPRLAPVPDSGSFPAPAPTAAPALTPAPHPAAPPGPIPTPPGVPVTPGPTAALNEPNLPYATPVPGRPGYVVSPYAPDSGDVDVRGLSPGQQARCPHTQKLFIVPGAEP